MGEYNPFVFNCVFFFALIGYSSISQFKLKSIFVDNFRKPPSKYSVDLHGNTIQKVGFILQRIFYFVKSFFYGHKIWR